MIQAIHCLKGGKCPRLSRGTAILTAAFTLCHAAVSQADPAFTPTLTEACVAQAREASPNLSASAVLDCAGRSAQACMNSPGGDTTIGMIDCLQGELQYWDKRLNTAYAARVATARKEDADMKRLKSSAPSIEESLRSMQRSWIAYRDAACLYEQSLWQGGTGGGPATAGCHMQETARQALKLEGWWSQ